MTTPPDLDSLREQIGETLCGAGSSDGLLDRLTLGGHLQSPTSKPSADAGTARARVDFTVIAGELRVYTPRQRVICVNLEDAARAVDALRDADRTRDAA